MDRRVRGLKVVGTSVAALVAAAAIGISAAGSGARAPDITRLFDRALAKVHKHEDFAKAVMLEAIGTPAGNDAVRSASAISRWEFGLANYDSPGSKYASVSINYRRSSGFSKPRGHKFPILEDVAIRKAPKMTLAEAVSILRGDGFGQRFYNVVLRRPLGPKSTPPLYIFAMTSNEFVAVNTKTGKAKRIR